MSTFNHRVMAHKSGRFVYLQIHEVYYDDNGVPDGYTQNAVTVGGETTAELVWVLDKMKLCLDKPILWAGDKFPKEYKSKKK